MATYYLYESRETKPTEQTVWWPNAFPVESDTRKNVIDSMAVMFNYALEDANTKKFQLYFNTEEDFLTFATTMEGLSSTPGRNAYNTENGIVTTVLFKGLVTLG
jgi:hypothetical protein